MLKESEIENIGANNLKDRIRFCMNRVKNGVVLADSAGIPRRTLENYLSGSSEPKTSVMVKIAKAAGVSVSWLATGEGEPDQNHPESQPTEGFSEKTIRSSIIALKSYLDKDNSDLAPHDLAEAVFLGCELANEDGIISQETVKRLMKFKGK